MILKQVPVHDFLTTNAYFYVDEETKHGFLIDPAAEADKLLKIIKDNDFIIEKMLITHGHFDHIGAVDEIHRALNIPYYIHENGKQYLENGDYNLSFMCNRNIRLLEGQYLHDGEIIENKPQNLSLKVIYTPGHTGDSVAYYDEANRIAFVGDTIFKESVGRTDFVGGNLHLLMQSISNKIFSLPDDVMLYSGHSEPISVLSAKEWYFSNFL